MMNVNICETLEKGAAHIAFAVSQATLKQDHRENEKYVDEFDNYYDSLPKHNSRGKAQESRAVPSTVDNSNQEDDNSDMDGSSLIKTACWAAEKRGSALLKTFRNDSCFRHENNVDLSAGNGQDNSVPTTEKEQISDTLPSCNLDEKNPREQEFDLQAQPNSCLGKKDALVKGDNSLDASSENQSKNDDVNDEEDTATDSESEANLFNSNEKEREKSPEIKKCDAVEQIHEQYINEGVDGNLRDTKEKEAGQEIENEVPLREQDVNAMPKKVEGQVEKGSGFDEKESQRNEAKKCVDAGAICDDHLTSVPPTTEKKNIELALKSESQIPLEKIPPENVHAKNPSGASVSSEYEAFFAQWNQPLVPQEVDPRQMPSQDDLSHRFSFPLGMPQQYALQDPMYYQKNSSPFDTRFSFGDQSICTAPDLDGPDNFSSIDDQYPQPQGNMDVQKEQNGYEMQPDVNGSDMNQVRSENKNGLSYRSRSSAQMQKPISRSQQQQLQQQQQQQRKSKKKLNSPQYRNSDPPLRSPINNGVQEQQKGSQNNVNAVPNVKRAPNFDVKSEINASGICPFCNKKCVKVYRHMYRRHQKEMRQ